MIYFKINAIYSSNAKQSSMVHDPSEIILICWIDAQETFLIIINVENCDAFFSRFFKWV